jgi:Kdo2-lipid IVA lauroyltransferase/acyltransferase
MKIKLILIVLKLLALLPLRINHAIGAFLGKIAYFTSRKYAALIRENLTRSNLCRNPQEFEKTLKQVIMESGKALIETFAIWFKDYRVIQTYCHQFSGWSHIEKALKAQRGIIFLTPHLGCFEITSLYYGQFHPITVLFRPPRQKALMPAIIKGRERGLVRLAPANQQGVKQLVKALKQGEAIGILPDQAPLEGEGEWAPFFNHPAYTMTLASKLAEKTGAQVLMAFGERLPKGKGYHIHVTPIADGAIATPAQLNLEIEKLIATCPEQYLWGYNRYKVRTRSS